MERNEFNGLAHIELISHLSPIDGCDNIELARVLGWNVIVQKGFTVGDMAIFIEIDSILPVENPVFTFLGGKRIKTKKMKGVISQGIVFPCSILPPEITPTVGLDVTQALNLTKYDPEVTPQSNGRVFTESQAPYPSFIIKTDENRIQNVGRMVTEYGNEIFYITEKYDGTSCTMFRKDDTIGVCSRNLMLKEFTSTGETNHYWEMYRKYNFDKVFAENDNLVIQGEIVGNGIQNNKYKYDNKDFYIFNIIDLNGYRRYTLDEMVALLIKYNLKMVAVLNESFTLPSENLVDEMVKLSVGQSVLNPNTKREGIVVRSHKTDLPIGQVSFKVINPEFLIKYDC
jgi:RNA ligase (TIGR02306 family)